MTPENPDQMAEVEREVSPKGLVSTSTVRDRRPGAMTDAAASGTAR